MKKEKIRGIGDNQNPITEQLEKAMSIIRKDVFNPICDLQTNGKVTFSKGAFWQADKASEKCLEANDLINNCIQVMKGLNDKR